MVIYNRRYETLSREDIDQLQLERLQSTMKSTFKNVPFYQNEMKKRDLSPGDITEIESLKNFVFTTREDLSYNYPYGLFAVPLRDIVRINSTSGLAGRPAVLGYTKNDLNVWVELLSRLFVASDVSADDIVQISLVYGLANWGRSIMAAAENIEASVIPMSYLNPKKELMIISDYRVSCLVSTPSHALHLVGLLDEMGMDKDSLSLKRGILIAESVNEDDRSRIEEGLGVKTSTAYGIPEAMGPGVAYECSEGRLHISQDHFIVEVIDPNNGRQLAPGEEGELVITTITTRAFPLLRFRTGDISRVTYEDACGCKRTTATMEIPKRRSDDVLSIKGVKVYPSQIEKVLSDILDEIPSYAIVLYKVKELDEMDLLIEEVESIFSDEIKVLEGIKFRIENDLLEILGIRANVKLVEKRTIKELVRGEKRVIEKK